METKERTERLLEYLNKKYKTEAGLITAPVRLKGQPLYAAYYYELGRAFVCDVKHQFADFFVVTEQDRAAFPELGSAYGVELWNNSGSFVSSLFGTKDAYVNYLDLAPEDQNIGNLIDDPAGLLKKSKFDVWQLAPDSDPKERYIIVTDNGDVEVSGIIEKEEDARLFAAALNLLWHLGKMNTESNDDGSLRVELDEN